ncbi:MAG: hypothetical protein NTW38_12875 [Candidatus Aminicenantes bacterium]|nr:hypothetical protein [Candidatus Aminicenantes bacterium]
MKQEYFARFLEKQRKKIDEEKWIEGTRICRDPGQEFVTNWINKNAEKFRKEHSLGELACAFKELEEMLVDLKNQVIDINKLIEYVQDIQDKIEIAQEALQDRE